MLIGTVVGSTSNLKTAKSIIAVFSYRFVACDVLDFLVVDFAATLMVDRAPPLKETPVRWNPTVSVMERSLSSIDFSRVICPTILLTSAISFVIPLTVCLNSDELNSEAKVVRIFNVICLS